MQIRTIELESDADPKAVGAELARLGQWLSPQKDQDGLIRSFIVDPSSCAVELKLVESIAGVKRALGGVSPHPLVDRLAHRHLSVGGASFGETRPWRADALHRQTAPLLIAGPCSFESEQVVHEVAQLVASAGGKWLRGGAYKPRTSPYSFQGEGAKALSWAREAADLNHLALVTEALSEEEVELVATKSDLIQIGTRNMQNFSLLKRVGRTGKPTLLKRGLCATIDEWLLAGEYLMKHGASEVIFCERGLRHYDPTTRNLLDLGAAALIKHHYGLPVIVDPSHALGRRDLIAPLAIAAVAMGVDGVMVEMHPDPGQAKSDAAQALSPSELESLSMALGVRQTSSFSTSEDVLSFTHKTDEVSSEQRSLS
jgi:3-deoxy-7-phosphoheptulonate synthase